VATYPPLQGTVPYSVADSALIMHSYPHAESTVRAAVVSSAPYHPPFKAGLLMLSEALSGSQERSAPPLKRERAAVELGLRGVRGVEGDVDLLCADVAVRGGKEDGR
jgi:hypothetical protein